MHFDSEPVYIEVPNDRDMIDDGVDPKQLKNGGNFEHCIRSELSGNKSVVMVFVLIDNDSHHKLIKKSLDQIGVPSQFLLFKNITKKMSQMGVWSNILKQVNAKCGLDLYRIQYSQKVRNSQTMVVGLDVVNMGGTCVVGLTASYNEALTQFYSEVVEQNLHKDNKEARTKREQDYMICKNRCEILQGFLLRAFENYQKKNGGKRPEMIVFYRDGVGGPASEQFVIELEGQNSPL